MLFLQCFRNASFSGSLKVWIVQKRVNASSKCINCGQPGQSMLADIAGNLLLVPEKVKPSSWLTLYQTKIFSLIPNWKHLQTKNESELEIDICMGKGRKYCGKRRKCWLPAFSPFPTPFPTMFSKGLFLKVFKSQDCMVKSKPFPKQAQDFCVSAVYVF